MQPGIDPLVLSEGKRDCFTNKTMKRILVAEPEQAVNKKAFAIDTVRW